MKKLHWYCDIPLEEAINMCALYPAQVMQMPHFTGILKQGQKSS